MQRRPAAQAAKRSSAKRSKTATQNSEQYLVSFVGARHIKKNAADVERVLNDLLSSEADVRKATREAILSTKWHKEEWTKHMDQGEAVQYNWNSHPTQPHRKYDLEFWRDNQSTEPDMYHPELDLSGTGAEIEVNSNGIRVGNEFDAERGSEYYADFVLQKNKQGQLRLIGNFHGCIRERPQDRGPGRDRTEYFDSGKMELHPTSTRYSEVHYSNT